MVNGISFHKLFASVILKESPGRVYFLLRIRFDKGLKRVMMGVKGLSEPK